MTDTDTSSLEKYNDKLTLNWIIGITIILVLLTGTFIDWSFALGPLIVLTLYISTVKSPKALMFIGYHLIIGIVIYWFTRTFLIQLVDFEWSTGFDWIRKIIRVFFSVTILAIFAKSMITCWDSTTLKEYEIGQLSYFNWMPKFGSNVRNQFGGIFTGLPSFMVEIIAIDARIKTIKPKDNKPLPIQIEKYGGGGKKFEAEIEFNFKAGIDNTLVWIQNPNDDQDLINIVVQELTKWLNELIHQYSDVSQLKEDIGPIKDHIDGALKDSSKRYGIAITEFNLVDIQVPQIQIKQQNEDEAAMRHQKAMDEQELVDTIAFNEQVALVMKQARDLSDPIDYKKAVEIVQLQRKTIRGEIIRGVGRGTIIDTRD